MFVLDRTYGRTEYQVGCDAPGCTTVLVDEDADMPALVCAPDFNEIPLHLMSDELYGRAWTVGESWRIYCPEHTHILTDLWHAARSMDPLFGARPPAPVHTHRIRVGRWATHAARPTIQGWEFLCGNRPTGDQDERAATAAVTCTGCIIATALYLNPPPADQVESLYRLVTALPEAGSVEGLDLDQTLLALAVHHKLVHDIYGTRYSLANFGRAWRRQGRWAPWADSWGTPAPEPALAEAR